MTLLPSELWARIGRTVTKSGEPPERLELMAAHLTATPTAVAFDAIAETYDEVFTNSIIGRPCSAP